MTLGALLLAILSVLLIVTVAGWPYNGGEWSYGSSGALGVVLIVALVLVLKGRS